MISFPVGPRYGEDKCTLCPLGEKDHVLNTCIPARTLDGQAAINQVDYLFVGEAPGATENREGSPFVGRSGQLLTRILGELGREYGLEDKRCALTNSVRCQPESNSNPPMACKRACRPYLDKEIEVLKPKVIICVGLQAWQALHDKATGLGSLASNRLQQSTYKDTPMFVVYHPAAVLRNNHFLEPLVSDLERILVDKIWLDKEETQVDYEIINTVEDFNHFTQYVETTHLCVPTEISLDIETTGLEVDSLLVSVALTLNNSETYFIPAFHKESNLRPVQVIDFLGMLLADSYVTLVGHNLLFDISRIKHSWEKIHHKTLDIKCRIKDSMVYDYLRNENGDNRSLDYLTKELTDLEPYKGEVDRTNLRAEPLHKLAKYNALDTIAPLKIIEAIEDKTTPEMVNFYSELIPFLSCIESSGFKIDTTRLHEVKTELEKQCERTQREVEELSEGINLNSSQQLSDFIYGTLGIPVPRIRGIIGASGKPSTSKDVLDRLHGHHPFIDSLLKYRRSKKDLSTYVGNITRSTTPGGFVHPEFFPVKVRGGGTVTGRLTCKKPPLQTIPYTDIRSVFVPRNKDGILLDIDASQMELRYAAWESQDETLLNIFSTGLDPSRS